CAPMLHAKPTATRMRSAVTRREATWLGGAGSHAVRSAAMEGGEGRGPGYDDWFDEPEPPTETQSAARGDVYDGGDEEVWVLPDEEDGRDRGHRGGIVIGGRTLTTTQVVIIAVSILAVFFAILAAAGVFSSSPTVPTVTTPPPPTTTQAT